MPELVKTKAFLAASPRAEGNREALFGRRKAMKRFLALVFVFSVAASFAWCAEGRAPRGNVFANPMDASEEEQFEDLTIMPAMGEVAVERIFSEGQASPDDFWYDQEWDEWVMIVTGGAELELETPSEVIKMVPGDWVYLPAHCVHRVKSTEKGTVWLAVHVGRVDEE